MAVSGQVATGLQMTGNCSKHHGLGDGRLFLCKWVARKVPSQTEEGPNFRAGAADVRGTPGSIPDEGGEEGSDPVRSHAPTQLPTGAGGSRSGADKNCKGNKTHQNYYSRIYHYASAYEVRRQDVRVVMIDGRPE